MKFTNEGTWFYFNDEKPEEGGVCLRTLSPNDLARIEKETVTIEREYRKVAKRDPAQMFEIRKVNAEKRMQMQWDALIVDWKGIENEKGEIKCTPANKVKMMGDYAEFAMFVGASVAKLVEEQPSTEELEKNSSSLLSD